MKTSTIQRQIIEGLRAKAQASWKAGRPDEAERLYAELLTHDRTDAAALEALGHIAVFRGDEAGARKLFERAVKAEPNRLSAQVNLADVLHQAGEDAAALKLAQRVLIRKPDNALAHFLVGDIAWNGGDFDVAIASLERAADLSSDLAWHIKNLMFERLDRCDWRGHDAQVAYFENRLRAGKPNGELSLPLVLLDSPADLLQGAKTYAEDRYPAKPGLWTGQVWGHERIRIGYVTGEANSHAVGAAIAGVLEHHDHKAFEIHAFSHGADDRSPIRDRIVASLDRFVDVSGLDDLAAARLMLESEIDIAVTLSGYTRAARPGILAHRPAPAQVSYLGFPCTMGTPCIDYLIADGEVIPPGDEGFYSETIVRLPDCYHPTDDKAQIAARAPTRAEAGLPPDGFVFMAYGQTVKITPKLFGTWMRILMRAEGSVLWLTDKGPQACENLRREAAAQGVDPARLVFADRAEDRADHLARHALADLYLDTLPYNAHSSATDALWAGLPVLTCRGATFPSRVGASMLKAAGLPDLITDTLADYEDLAAALAGDKPRLAAIGAQVAGPVRASALFDTARYTRSLEAALRAIHERARPGP